MKEIPMKIYKTTVNPSIPVRQWNMDVYKKERNEETEVVKMKFLRSKQGYFLWSEKGEDIRQGLKINFPV